MITIAQAGAEYKIAEDYRIVFNPNAKFLVLSIGHTIDKAASTFLHPNIFARFCQIMEFKHSRKNGSKRWTSKPGVVSFLAISTDKIFIVPKKTYSYPEFMINGVKVCLNVTGIGSNGWTDVVSAVSGTLVNMPKTSLMKLCQAAVPLDTMIKMGLEYPEIKQGNDFINHFMQMSAEKICSGKIKAGDKVVAKTHVSWNGYKPTEPMTVSVRPLKARYFLVDKDYYKLKVDYPSINWVETAKLKGIDIPDPRKIEFNFLEKVEG